MFRTPLRRLVGRVAAGALVVATPVVLTPAPASAATADLLLSEYVEGSSFNKAVEIYNGTGADVDLAAGGYRLELYSNGSPTVSQSLALTGVVAAGDVFVAAHPSADPAVLAEADVTNGGTVNWNGDDAIVLRHGDAVIDSLGQVGVDPGSQWGTGDASTADNTLRRKTDVCTGDTDPSDAFDPAAEWDGYPNNTFDGLGSHTANCGGGGDPGEDEAPAVTSVSPADGGSATTGQSPVITFSEPVTLADGAVSLSCTGSGDVEVAVTGGPTEYTVDPATDLADGESCTLTVAADGVSDVDDVDPPDTMADDVTATFSVVDTCTADYTPIPEIQGSGPEAAVTGAVTTKGVVVADYEGPSPALRGFYLQDLEGDGDPATSDGIFVFNGNADSVAEGDVVRVSGTAGEFQGQTQISGALTIEACGTGSVPPTEVTLPFADAGAPERYEGMLVTMPQTLSVTEHYQLGRFGQVTVSSGGRLQQPTSVVAPGPEAGALQAENDLNRVIIDDTLQSQNPDPIVWGRGGQPLTAENTLRGGDTTTGATGVLTYTWAGNSASGNAYRLRPLDRSGDGIEFTAVNERPTTAPEVGGDVQVVGMNLLNYFDTFTGCTGGVTGAPMDCRGADDQQELDRQTAKTVAAIAALDADVVGVNEVENDGYGADSALQHLVDAVNAEVGAGTYAVLDVDARTGTTDALGGDAIKVGALYKPAAVTPVGDTAVLDTEAFVNGGDASPKNRVSLLQAWRVEATGGVFLTNVNHLKSKGSACETPDTGDGQGNCAVVRTNAVRELLDWFDTDPTGTGDTDLLLVGDYNAYARETPIRTLEDGGFTNLVREYQGEDAYSYVFDGQWGYLDHALGSESLLGQVTGVADYHIDADEPSVLDYNTDFKSANQVESLYAPDEYRVSDHDPVVVGLSPTVPNAAPTVEASFGKPLVPCGADNASLTVDIADPDAGDTHTVEVAWGDGSSDTTETSEDSVTLTHTYAEAGRYTATVTVTDGAGHEVTTEADVAVAYRLDVLPHGRTVTARRGGTVPVLALVRGCDGKPARGIRAPVATLTDGDDVVARGTVRPAGPVWVGGVRTTGLDRGTYTLVVTLPDTGQTHETRVRLR
ncbi:ExeM/NucH family extracellular endonuclease [Phycicoccus sp. CSK15P-2]|uniref:ExeM/NucH family extracellular endonuclease n=1 Tax=Phycicoccus sp. CSK15P-2 TaxID=2807627 RepID=UPI00194FDCCC|nr:ExeM/NucH family extracellular endonuclease [Phycicoccus sp. CSK15P-2]MBM6405853.1 ExeM/NucH family extracellular endonuclease [Phycicoccus sp. CSK15P-2]